MAFSSSSASSAVRSSAARSSRGGRSLSSALLRLLRGGLARGADLERVEERLDVAVGDVVRVQGVRRVADEVDPDLPGRFARELPRELQARMFPQGDLLLP